ncbi:hypothetical protein SPI_07386 [Niveomyces insectorum RCEF 264]|uniref:Uncharacterized protein n=1 Tax=Niveomyces insectorum RCEF 264 TaxID=1081102 RepID=A0A162IGY1_9HYPO|nr:hypothetical protein SPI_07386 [Niveomyces insectorum RCEF 264]
MQHPKETVSLEEQRRRRAQRAVTDIYFRLRNLARLGRAGQWILHHEDLYHPQLDTRPHSRNHDKEVRLYTLYPPDRSGLLSRPPLLRRDYGLVWDGREPAPDFQDPTFWERKRKELKEKMEDVKAGRVQPGFTPEEEQRLESLERKRSEEQRQTKLAGAISDVYGRLRELMELGRAGQWILHHEDLYHPELDTRPHSRSLDEEVPIRSVITSTGIPYMDLVWAGKGPVPDFEDASFWEGKCKELKDKVDQVKAGFVQPHFSPDEEQKLESLKEQDGHFLFKVSKEKKRKAADAKHRILGYLLRLAGLGLPGQWVLHNEEFYNPAIDTRRPETRKGEKSVVIRDSTYYTGVTRCEWVWNTGALIDRELIWAGKGPQPDFADDDYWIDKAEDLLGKIDQVEKGLVEPRFTAEERQVLESMEKEDGHFYAELARERRENPPVEEEEQTPESYAAWRNLINAKCLVWNHLSFLWDSEEYGLAGKWVVYKYDLYNPEHDIRRRHRNQDEDDPRTHVLLGGPTQLHYYGDKRLPEFDDIAYWEARITELENIKDEIRKGHVKHGFTEGQLRTIALIEREIWDALQKESDDDEERPTGVEAWLNSTDTAEARLPAPPRSRTPSIVFSDGVGRGFSDATRSVGSEPGQVPNPEETRKRKRSTNHGDEELLPPAHTSKRCRTQPQPGPTPTMPAPSHTSRHRPPTALQNHRPRRTAPPAVLASGPPNAKMADQLVGGRRTRQSTRGIVRGENAQTHARRQTAKGSRTGRQTKRGVGSAASTALETRRRSARIAALPRRDYTWRGLCQTVL